MNRERTHIRTIANLVDELGPSGLDIEEHFKDLHHFQGVHHFGRSPEDSAIS